MSIIQSCVACGSNRWYAAERYHGFQLAKCEECGLTFTLNPDYRIERYEAAYEGKGDIPVAEEHSYVYKAPAQRLRLEALAYLVPPPRLTPAERLALSWLKKNAPQGSVIVDCGCGTGRFLRALASAGFKAVGVDISPEVISLLNKAGLTAIQGKAPDFPWSEEPPFAITFFEVLEHIPTPIEVLTALRKRFTEAAILASVPSPYRPGLLLKGERGLSDYPPNHFLRWTPKALEIAFQRAGYKNVEVILPKPIGSEMLPGLGQLVFRMRRGLQTRRKPDASDVMVRKPSSADYDVIDRLKATGALWVLWLYQKGTDIVGYLRVLKATRFGASASSLLVIAVPDHLESH
ncbi:MAG: hypothetical protein KatS3mg078_1676 [Deltaproteobacteria bacterium]|nr:MAG: hypothetical protein KatS3mg078_1676 [Deltaproteobacteria bacterium]